MSALTDYFTSLANKIRSKTGGSGTYTPAEMVSDGIDDVYDAGVAAGGGGTSITPSNSTPVALTANVGVKPTTAGYAIESYNNITPSDASPVTITSGSIYRASGGGKAVANVNDITPNTNSPVSLASGTIYKTGGTGYAIASYNSNSLSDTSAVSLATDKMYKFTNSGYAIKNYSGKTPSDTSPPALTKDYFYKPSANGYLVSNSPTSITPTTSGASFSAGLRYMSSSGYAYSSKPSSGGLTATTLWTNSSPSSSFAAQTVTLSSAITNYTYVRVTVRVYTSNSSTYTVIYPSSEAKNVTTASAGAYCLINGYNGSDNYVRRLYFPSTTQAQFTTCYCLNKSGNTAAGAIPTKIEGLK